MNDDVQVRRREEICEPSSTVECEIKMLLGEEDVARPLDSIEMIMVKSFFAGMGVVDTSFPQDSTIRGWLLWQNTRG